MLGDSLQSVGDQNAASAQGNGSFEIEIQDEVTQEKTLQQQEDQLRILQQLASQYDKNNQIQLQLLQRQLHESSVKNRVVGYLNDLLQQQDMSETACKERVGQEIGENAQILHELSLARSQAQFPNIKKNAIQNLIGSLQDENVQESMGPRGAYARGVGSGLSAAAAGARDEHATCSQPDNIDQISPMGSSTDCTALDCGKVRAEEGHPAAQDAHGTACGQISDLEQTYLPDGGAQDSGPNGGAAQLGGEVPPEPAAHATTATPAARLSAREERVAMKFAKGAPPPVRARGAAKRRGTGPAPRAKRSSNQMAQYFTAQPVRSQPAAQAPAADSVPRRRRPAGRGPVSVQIIPSPLKKHVDLDLLRRSAALHAPPHALQPESTPHACRDIAISAAGDEGPAAAEAVPRHDGPGERGSPSAVTGVWKNIDRSMKNSLRRDAGAPAKDSRRRTVQ